MLTPIGKRLIIVPVETKKGPLLLTTIKPTQFNVVAIGDEVKKVKIGDVIFLEKCYGIDIEHENEKFMVINEDTILAKL